MPFSNTLSEQPFIELAQRLRHDPVTGYGIALAVVAVATFARAVLAPELVPGVTFITFYPAIVIATFLGGWRPGLTALAISFLTAWYAFLPPPMSWSLDRAAVVSLLLFATLSGLNVGIIALLNASIDRIVTQEKNQRILLDSTPNGFVVADRGGVIRLVNASAERMFGYDRRELAGEMVERLVPHTAAGAHGALRETFHHQPKVRAMGNGRDLKGRRKDGSEFPLEIGLSPLVANGRHSVLATVIDISERKKMQGQRELLIDELRHRTRNLFVIAQVIARRSLDEGRTMTEARDVIVGRLNVLAQAYAALGSRALESTSLTEILTRELAAYPGRAAISGCDIVLKPRAVEQLMLVVHELATNAAKYGALSLPEGGIVVDGRVEDRAGVAAFRFGWRESGGPAVKDPARKGFGSTVLIDTVKPTASHVALTFAPEGLVYELELPLDAIAIETAKVGVAAA